MKKIKLKTLILAISLVACSALGVYTAFAETVSQSLTVSPPTQKLILSPGESYDGSIKISNSNSSTRDLKYSAFVGSFSETGGENSKDDYGTVDHISTSDYNQIMDWITLEKDSGTVAPNAVDFLNYTINVPENVPAGGQYATIIIRDDTDESVASTEDTVAIQSSFQFASIIYAEVSGETKQTGKVLENNVPAISFSAPLTVSSMVENTGNVHTDAKYTLQIWPLFSNEEVYSNEEEPMTSLILPETKRYKTQTWEDAPMIGIFKVKQTVEIYDGVSVVERIVVICPLWLMLTIIFVVVAAIILIIFKIKSHKNRKKGVDAS